jgi:hypothetical protein
MRVNINKLHTLRNWAETYTRVVGKTTVVGCSIAHAHDLFDEKNNKPAALRARAFYQLVIIDGVKFVAKRSDLPKPKTQNNETANIS